MKFKKIKLSEESTKKLKSFKTKTELTPNVACRIALGLSISQNSIPSLELYDEDATGQEINRYTLMGEYDLLLIGIFKQWCIDNDIKEEEYFNYFMAHINRGIELLTSRVKSIENIADLI